jgi:hypothetical protein
MRLRYAVFAAIGVCVASGLPQAASASDETWRLEPTARVELGVVSAETATRDEQIVVDGDAVTVRGQVGLEYGNDKTRFRIEADRIEVFRLGQGRPDTNRDRLTFQVDQELNDDWDVQFRLRMYDDFVTAESSDTDETQGAVEVTYEPVQAHRFTLGATWREREYDQGTNVQTKGRGPRFDAGYRHRLGRYHYINFNLRAESIQSDDPERGFARQSASLSYTQPITPDLRVRPAIEYLNTRFDGRMNQQGEHRRDQLVVPEVELLWWPGQWRVEAEAKYVFSGSNVPTREREGYRLTLAVGYVF